MKAVTVRQAEVQLSRLIAEANGGEVVVLTDGEKQSRLRNCVLIKSMASGVTVAASTMKNIVTHHLVLITL